MNELDRDLVFSEAVKAGKRIYYFDVKQSRNGDRYISITESKKIVEGPAENPRISFEKHKLFLYKEDYDKFMTALTSALEVAKTGIIPEKPEPAEEALPSVEEKVEAAVEETTPIATETPISAPKADEDTFKIDLDF